MKRTDKQEIKKNKREIEEICKRFRKKIDEARKNGKTRDEIREIEYNEYFERNVCRDIIDEIRTKDIRERAYKYNVIMPERENEKMWRETEIERNIVLTEEGMQLINKQIDCEQRERIKIYLLIVSTIGSITIGLLGALIGLISLIAK